MREETSATAATTAAITHGSYRFSVREPEHSQSGTVHDPVMANHKRD